MENINGFSSEEIRFLVLVLLVSYQATQYSLVVMFSLIN